MENIPLNYVIIIKLVLMDKYLNLLIKLVLLGK